VKFDKKSIKFMKAFYDGSASDFISPGPESRAFKAAIKNALSGCKLDYRDVTIIVAQYAPLLEDTNKFIRRATKHLFSQIKTEWDIHLDFDSGQVLVGLKGSSGQSPIIIESRNLY
jgi:hypothetical protein